MPEFVALIARGVRVNGLHRAAFAVQSLSVFAHS